MTPLPLTQAPVEAAAHPGSYEVDYLKAARTAHRAQVKKSMRTPFMAAWNAGKGNGSSLEWVEFLRGMRVILSRLEEYRLGKYVFPAKCFDCGQWTGLDRWGRDCLVHNADGESMHCDIDALHFLCSVYEPRPEGGTKLPSPAGYKVTEGGAGGEAVAMEE